MYAKINSSSNTIDILLSHWDWENEENKSQMTEYNLELNSRFYTSTACCDDDAGSSKDAFVGEGLFVEPGSHHGSFIHLTDQSDHYTINVAC